MPTYVIDTGSTFSAMLLMASGPKLKFGTPDQDISASGERKWEVQAAATWHTEPGMRPISELIRVTILGGSDPAAGLLAGTPIQLDGLRLGVSTPESGEGGRVRGGKPWYQAAAVHSLNGRPGKSDG
jgi:hypothetical protein